MSTASETTSLFRVRVPEKRLRKAEIILARLGMKPGDAFNMLPAQIELREGLPFEVTTRPPVVLDPEPKCKKQVQKAWLHALGICWGCEPEDGRSNMS